MADQSDSQQLAQQLARAEVSNCIARLVKLSAGQGGRGAANALRATLALLELAGVTTPAASGVTEPPDSAASGPPQRAGASGGKGAPPVRLVAESTIREFYARKAGGEK